MSRKVTMQHIADRLGVSKYVISKALSGKPGVSDATRDRVMRMAGQLGYLSQKKRAAYTEALAYANLSGTLKVTAATAAASVLVLMPNIRFQTKESMYWGKLLDGISRGLETRGSDMLTLTLNSAEGLSHLVQPRTLPGIIGVGEISRGLLLEVQRLGLPLVLLDHDAPYLRADQIFAHNRESAFRVVQYLIGLGHRKLQFVGNIAFAKSFLERWHGFREALEEAGLAHDSGPFESLLHLEELNDHLQEQQIREVLQPYISQECLPTALVCANDRIAASTIKAVRSLGLSVPEDMSVTGFDNIDTDYTLEPELTTVNVNKEQLGMRAVDLLFWRIANREMPSETWLIKGDVVIRNSAVPPSK